MGNNDEAEFGPIGTLETERLHMRELDPLLDAGFMLGLLNDPGFVAGIADMGVRDEAGATAYIERSCVKFYRGRGFGMFGVVLKECGTLVGIMGLLAREGLADPDLGFAFLEGFTGRGFAKEAGLAALADARGRCGLRRVVAITSVSNAGSMGVLGSLGFEREGMVRLTDDGDELVLFGIGLPKR